MAKIPISTDDNPDNLVELNEVSIPDFPTPFYHASNHDGTRDSVLFSELQDYVNSMK